MTAQKRNVGIKYCGGCNPGYDRVALVEEVKKLLREEAVLVGVDEEVDVVLAVQGCRTSCADLSPYTGKEVAIISSEQGLMEAIDKLKS